jgi:hypothetical protein
VTTRGIPFTDDEMERIAAEARKRSMGRAQFIRQCVLRTINPGYTFTDEEDARVAEAARALNAAKPEFCVRAILHACDEVEAIGTGYRQPISPFREGRG